MPNLMSYGRPSPPPSRAAMGRMFLRVAFAVVFPTLWGLDVLSPSWLVSWLLLAGEQSTTTCVTTLPPRRFSQRAAATTSVSCNHPPTAVGHG